MASELFNILTESFEGSFDDNEQNSYFDSFNKDNNEERRNLIYKWLYEHDGFHDWSRYSDQDAAWEDLKKLFVLNDDFTIDYNGQHLILTTDWSGDVPEDQEPIREFPDYIQFNIVKGCFTLDETWDELRTLKGCPKEVYGSVTIACKYVDSLDYCPTVIYGDLSLPGLYCADMKNAWSDMKMVPIIHGEDWRYVNGELKNCTQDWTCASVDFGDEHSRYGEYIREQIFTMLRYKNKGFITCPDFCYDPENIYDYGSFVYDCQLYGYDDCYDKEYWEDWCDGNDFINDPNDFSWLNESLNESFDDSFDKKEETENYFDSFSREDNKTQKLFLNIKSAVEEWCGDNIFWNDYAENEEILKTSYYKDGTDPYFWASDNLEYEEWPDEDDPDQDGDIPRQYDAGDVYGNWIETKHAWGIANLSYKDCTKYDNLIKRYVHQGTTEQAPPNFCVPYWFIIDIPGTEYQYIMPYIRINIYPKEWNMHLNGPYCGGWQVLYDKGNEYNNVERSYIPGIPVSVEFADYVNSDFSHDRELAGHGLLIHKVEKDPIPFDTTFEQYRVKDDDLQNQVRLFVENTIKNYIVDKADPETKNYPFGKCIKRRFL